MKPDIHPTWHSNARVTCVSCGAVWTVGSTKEEIQTEVCSQCHSFYTGQKRMLDTTGRVERFEERMKKMSKQSNVRTDKKNPPQKERKNRTEAKKLG